MRSSSSDHGAWRLEKRGLAQHFQWPWRVASGITRGRLHACGTSIALWVGILVFFLSGMCKVFELWASTSSVESRGFRGTVVALTLSPHWVPCPTERRAVAYTYYTLDTWLTGKRIGAYTFYTLGTMAHGAARRPLHLVHFGYRGARVAAAGLTPARPPSGFWMTSQRLRRWVAQDPGRLCRIPRIRNKNIPTSLFLPLPRPPCAPGSLTPPPTAQPGAGTWSKVVVTLLDAIASTLQCGVCL